MTTLADIEWVDVLVKTHLFDWKPGEVRKVNYQDAETKAMIGAGLLEVIDPETAALMPPVYAGAEVVSKGCGCGS